MHLSEQMEHDRLSRSDSVGAGTPEDESEITPAMLSAGLRAFALWDYFDPDEWKVSHIYRAMESARVAPTVTETVPLPPGGSVVKNPIALE
jgi:hypothetical protein